MTTAELLAALARECPNGVSFNPMTLRLLRQKVPFEDWQIEDVKSAMFQLGSGLWFSRDMILDDKSRLAFEQAMKWLTEYGCFSIERDCRKTHFENKILLSPGGNLRFRIFHARFAVGMPMNHPDRRHWLNKAFTGALLARPSILPSQSSFRSGGSSQYCEPGSKASIVC